MKKQEIKLGDKVRCIITGFTGITIAKTEFLNKCVQWSVLPKMSKEAKTKSIMPEEVAIDEESLEVVKKPTKKVKKIEKNGFGGPMRRNLTRRNF